MGAAGGAAAGAAAAAARAQAIKALGAIVRVEPETFAQLAHVNKNPLVVVSAPTGLFNRNFSYLLPYKGLIFYTTSRQALHLPGDAEVVAAQTIWVPS